MPAVHDELTKTWRAPTRLVLTPSTSATLTIVDEAEEKPLPLKEAMTAHLCQPSTCGFKSAAHPSKPCRMTSTLAKFLLQVFQAKFLSDMDESGRDPSTFKELCTVTDLALSVTKATSHAIGKAMANLVVLEHHLWLNLTEIRDTEKITFLNSRSLQRDYLALPLTGSLNSSQIHRRHHRLYITSCLSIPAQRLFQSGSRPHQMGFNSALEWPGSTPSRNIKVPAPM